MCIHCSSTYMNGIYMYVILIYLYSTVCLYNKSSEGVNLFCCSSSILGRKPLSKAAVCHILLPFVATGTGSLLSNVCSLSVKTCLLLALQATDKLFDGLLCFCSIWPGIIKITIFWTGTALILIVPCMRELWDIPRPCISIFVLATKTC